MLGVFFAHFLIKIFLIKKRARKTSIWDKNLGQYQSRGAPVELWKFNKQKNSKHLLECCLFFKNKSKYTCFLNLKITEIVSQNILSSWCKFHVPCWKKTSIENQKTHFYLQATFGNNNYTQWKYSSCLWSDWVLKHNLTFNILACDWE